MFGALRPGGGQAQAAEFFVDEVLDLFGYLHHPLRLGQPAENEQAGAAVVAGKHPERLVRRIVERRLVQHLQADSAGVPEVLDEQAEGSVQRVHPCSVYYRRRDGS